MTFAIHHWTKLTVGLVLLAACAQSPATEAVDAEEDVASSDRGPTVASPTAPPQTAPSEGESAADAPAVVIPPSNGVAAIPGANDVRAPGADPTDVPATHAASRDAGVQGGEAQRPAAPAPAATPAQAGDAAIEDATTAGADAQPSAGAPSTSAQPERAQAAAPASGGTNAAR